MDNAFDLMQYFLQNRSSPSENYNAYSDYNYELARDLGMKRSGPGAHMGDIPKLPWHPAFSNESTYYKPGMFAVDWNKPSGQQIDNRPRAMPTATPWIQQGAAMTKNFEGFRPEPYKDTKGVWTKGYGFNIKANKMDMNPITKEAAGDVFAPLYVGAMDVARKYAGKKWSTLNPNQQMILTDMAYNLGEDGLKGFMNMRKAIQAGKPASVRREMQDSDWYGQVGRRSQHHVKNW